MMGMIPYISQYRPTHSLSVIYVSATAYTLGLMKYSLLLELVPYLTLEFVIICGGSRRSHQTGFRFQTYMGVA